MDGLKKLGLKIAFWASILVPAFAVHEYGHFMMFNIFGVGVEEFKVMIGPEILRMEIGETRYALGCIPIGAYVKPANGPYKDDYVAAVRAANPKRAQLLLDASRHATILTPGQEILVLIAGPLANFITAIMIFAYWLKYHGTMSVTEAKCRLVNLRDRDTGEKLPNMEIVSVGGKAIERICEHLDPRNPERDLLEWMEHESFVVVHEFGGDVFRHDFEYSYPPIETQNFDLEIKYKMSPLNWNYAIPLAFEWIGQGIIAFVKLMIHRINILNCNKDDPKLFRPCYRHFVGAYWLGSMALLSEQLTALNLFVPIPPLDGGKLWISIFEATITKVPESIEKLALSLGAGLLLYALFVRPMLAPRRRD